MTKGWETEEDVQKFLDAHPDLQLVPQGTGFIAARNTGILTVKQSSQGEASAGVKVGLRVGDKVRIRSERGFLLNGEVGIITKIKDKKHGVNFGVQMGKGITLFWRENELEKMEKESKLPVSEESFSSYVEELLTLYGWHWCHFRPAQTEKGWRTAVSGDKGFPDYIAVRPPRLLIFELKSDKGQLSREQEEWMELLQGCQRTITAQAVKWKGQVNSTRTDLTYDELVTRGLLTIPEVYLWRPRDSDEIARILE